MSIKGKANIVGVFEHPTRKADDKSLFQLHAECALGALSDAGLGKSDIDGYFCAAGDTPGLGALSMIDYLGLKLRHWDSTDTGGSSYLLQVGHAAEAKQAGMHDPTGPGFAGEAQIDVGFRSARHRIASLVAVAQARKRSIGRGGRPRQAGADGD